MARAEVTFSRVRGFQPPYHTVAHYKCPNCGRVTNLRIPRGGLGPGGFKCDCGQVIGFNGEYTKAGSSRTKSHPKWIQKALAGAKPGALHRELHVPMNKTIPITKLRAAAKKGGIEGKRARLAITLRNITGHESHAKRSAAAKKGWATRRRRER
jgi:predicted RNA-binding Zn-ribbon protein involved in translation (DUF1610 family)